MILEHAWKAAAACRGYPTEWWFPPCGDTDTTENTDRAEFNGQAAEDAARAVAICRSCPAASECLAYGLREKFGIFGGKTPRERRRIVRGPPAPRVIRNEPRPWEDRMESVGRCERCGRRSCRHERVPA